MAGSRYACEGVASDLGLQRFILYLSSTTVCTTKFEVGRTRWICYVVILLARYHTMWFFSVAVLGQSFPHRECEEIPSWIVLSESNGCTRLESHQFLLTLLESSGMGPRSLSVIFLSSVRYPGLDKGYVCSGTHYCYQILYEGSGHGRDVNL